MFCPLQIVCFKTDGEQARKLCWLTSYSQKDKCAFLCKINFALIFLFFKEFNLSKKVKSCWRLLLINYLLSCRNSKDRMIMLKLWNIKGGSSARTGKVRRHRLREEEGGHFTEVILWWDQTWEEGSFQDSSISYSYKT